MSVESDPPMTIKGIPLYRCPVCHKQHIPWTGVACPCGEPFPREVQDVPCRGVAA